MSTLLILVGFAAFVIGIVAVIRGRLAWARISNRKTAAWATAGAFGVMMIGGALAPNTVETERAGVVGSVVTSKAATTTVVTPTVRPAPTSTTSTTTTLQLPVTTPLATRVEIPTTEATLPTTQVAVAPFVAPPPAPVVVPAETQVEEPPATSGGTGGGGWGECGDGYYLNTAGNCIASPQSGPQAPAGASAQCEDGTYSYSQSRRGTCSRHGGVAVWF